VFYFAYFSVNLQAAAAAHMLGKPDVFDAALNGDMELLNSHAIMHPNCVTLLDSRRAPSADAARDSPLSMRSLTSRQPMHRPALRCAERSLRRVPHAAASQS
jgi:hypothetical protein